MRYAEKKIRITVHNYIVSYHDEGLHGAPVIIFIHGFPLNKSMWDGQLEVLKDKYRVIAYDIRGHGNSDEGNEAFSVDLFVNDLICFMDALEIDKTILCGLSLGGTIALNAAESHPERFYALILSDTTCQAETPEAKEKRLKTIDSIRKNGVEKYAAESLKNLFTPDSFNTKTEEIETVREMIIKTTKHSLCNTLLAISLHRETCSKLQELKIPALIMVGKEDQITPPDTARLMNENFKDSVMYIIGHASHLSNLENPGEFNFQLGNFVKSVYTVN